jgi:hypothetical protein
VTKKLFETDHYAWLLAGIEETTRLGLLEVAEYLSEMSRSEKRALSGHVVNLMLHLLKWRYQPEKRTRSWELSIKNARKEIDYLLDKNPSMRPIVYSIATEDYKYAVRKAEHETLLDKETFPDELEFSLEQLLDNKFMPDEE